MRAVLVVNPIATTTSARTRDLVRAALDTVADVDLIPTTHRGHAVEIGEQAALDGVDAVVVLGGDGTVNEVVNGLLAKDPGSGGLPALGVVPGGSANVFIRALGASRNPEEASASLVAALGAGRRRRIGLGLLNGRRFIFCAGVGIDAAVIRRVEHARAAGRRATPGLYVRKAVEQYFRDTDRTGAPVDLTLTAADGVTETPGRFAAVIVQNCSPWTYLGSRPVNPCPEASFDRGLDVMAMRALGLGSTLRTVGQMLSTRPDPHGRRMVRRHDLTGVTLHSEHPIAAQVDGEYIGELTELRLQSEPAALDVII
jgi:diacylglycerol kinase family enzyme